MALYLLMNLSAHSIDSVIRVGVGLSLAIILDRKIPTASQNALFSLSCTPLNIHYLLVVRADNRPDGVCGSSFVSYPDLVNDIIGTSGEVSGIKSLSYVTSQDERLTCG